MPFPPLQSASSITLPPHSLAMRAMSPAAQRALPLAQLDLGFWLLLVYGAFSSQAAVEGYLERLVRTRGPGKQDAGGEIVQFAEFLLLVLFRLATRNLRRIKRSSGRRGSNLCHASLLSGGRIYGRLHGFQYRECVASRIDTYLYDRKALVMKFANIAVSETGEGVHEVTSRIKAKLV